MLSLIFLKNKYVVKKTEIHILRYPTPATVVLFSTHSAGWQWKTSDKHATSVWFVKCYRRAVLCNSSCGSAAPFASLEKKRRTARAGWAKAEGNELSSTATLKLLSACHQRRDTRSSRFSLLSSFMRTERSRSPPSSHCPLDTKKNWKRALGPWVLFIGSPGVSLSLI